MTRSKIRGYLERISDLEFQFIEPSIVGMISKLPHSQLLIDFAHVLGHRSSSAKAAEAIEKHVLQAYYETSGKKGIYLALVKKIRDRVEAESEKEHEANRLFHQHSLKLRVGLKLFLENPKTSDSAQRMLALFDNKQEETEDEFFDEYDYLNFLKLQRKLLLSFDSEKDFSERIRSLIDSLQDEIEQLDISDPIY